MPNANWACFSCRRSVRRDDGAGEVACPECGEPCTSVGRVRMLPPRRDTAGWRDLEARVRREAIRRADLQHRLRPNG